MTTIIKLKEAFEVESKFGAFFTGGNIEWISDDVLLCQKDTSLQCLNIETGIVEQIIEEKSEEVIDLIHTFTSNCSSIVTAHKSGLLKLWKHDGTLEKVWKSIHKGPVSKLCMNDSNILVSGGSDGVARVWDLTHQSCILALRGCEGVINIVVFHPLKNILFAAADDATIRSWELTKGNTVNVYNGHFSKITSITFCEDKEFMISAGRDKVIILWDIEKGNAVRTLPVFESVESVVSLPENLKIADIKCKNGIFVAAAGEKGIVKIWEMNSSKQVYTQTNSIIAPAKEDGGLSITNLLLNTKKKVFSIITVDHNIILYNLKMSKCLKQFVGFTDEILDLCFIGKEDSHLAVATNSADIKLYECKTMNCQLLQGHTDIVLSLCKTASDAHLLLSSGKDNTIRLWRMNEDNVVTCIGIGARHTGSVGSVAFSQTTSNFAVSVSQDTCLKVWEIPKTNTENQPLECLRTEIAHQKDINCVTVAPNDKIIATASQDKVAKLWTETLELIGVLRGHKRGIWSIRFSPVDQVVITSAADCTVKLWSIMELNCLKTLEGHDASVLKAEFLSNGMQILTAGADGLLKLFSVKTSECTATLDQHEGRIWALAIKSDETIIMSGGSDSLLVKWKDVTLQRHLQKAQEMEEISLQEQQLHNLVQNNKLLKALEVALKLDRPFQTLKIIEGIIKKGDIGLQETVAQLENDQKEALLKCATIWNTNSKHCQAAQLVINILLNELLVNKFRPAALSSTIEASLPYTERHFKRLTQLLQDLHFINYTVNCMQSHCTVPE